MATYDAFHEHRPGLFVADDGMGVRCMADFIAAVQSMSSMFDVYALLFGVLDKPVKRKEIIECSPALTTYAKTPE